MQLRGRHVLALSMAVACMTLKMSADWLLLPALSQRLLSRLSTQLALGPRVSVDALTRPAAIFSL